jgi:hypothetical protein
MGKNDMADFTFNCPHCKQSLEAPEEMLGTVIGCPTCQAQVKCTKDVPKHQFILKTQFPDSKTKNDRSETTPTVPLQGKKCPQCGIPLGSEAVICVGCGRNLKTGQSIQTDFNQPAVIHSQLHIHDSYYLEKLNIYVNDLTKTMRLLNNYLIQHKMVAGIVIVLIFGCWFGYTQVNNANDNKDDQFYEYSKVKAANAKSIKDQTDFLAGYVEKYSKGKHVGEMKALLEQAQEKLSKWKDEQKFGSILADCHITTGSGQTISVQGWLQLINITADAANEVMNNANNDPKCVKIMEDAKRIIGVGGDTSGFSSMHAMRTGEVISAQLQQKGQLVMQGNIQNGKLLFHKLQPGYYLLYGAGMGGRNVITYFEYIKVEPGQTTLTKRTFVTQFDADFVLDAWKPIR